jgi:hypothetical protein
MRNPTRTTIITRLDDRPRPRWRAATALLGAAALLLIPATAAHADPPAALPVSSNQGDAKWQPAMDYDTDGCYSSPAISPEGVPAEGLNNTGALNGNCRDQSDLDNTNAYARQKCNGEWCAHMYALYFEKDQVVAGADAFGHRNDIETIIVWVRNDQAEFVSTSAHGGFSTYAASEIQWEGSHPKVVYHKDGGQTHAFRPAGTGDEPPENHYGTWQYPALVSWDNYPAGVRDVFTSHDYGSASLSIKDGSFEGNLDKAKPADIAFDPFG